MSDIIEVDPVNRLAVVQPGVGKQSEASDQDDPLRELRQGGLDEYNIVVTARARGTVPTALWNSSYFVFVGEESKPV